jgi:LytS/YehU family sensor histidine kinase
LYNIRSDVKNFYIFDFQIAIKPPVGYTFSYESPWLILRSFLLYFVFLSVNVSARGSETGNKVTSSDNGAVLYEFLRTFWHIPVLMLVMIVTIVLLVRQRVKNIKRREHEKSILQQQLMQTEMRALRSQMNPHFIFNAINSIQHYVLTSEKELANKYLVKFSKLMRNILDQSKEELISLKEEIETVGLYLEIESLRFNNAFVYSISCDKDINIGGIRLPPLLIQPFVENAIWHGLLLKEGEKRLEIRVYTRNESLMIDVEDNGIGREMADKFRKDEFQRRSLGMDITYSRLQVLKKMHGVDISFRVQDKRENNSPTGTKVILEIKNLPS